MEYEELRSGRSELLTVTMRRELMTLNRVGGTVVVTCMSGEKRTVPVLARFCSWVDGGGAPLGVGEWEAGLG